MWEWLIVGGLLLIVLERFFTGTYLLAMGAGLLAAGLVRYTGDSVFVQALVFLFVTGILTIWQTKIYRKTLKGKSPLIGKTVVVIEAVDKGKGRVKVDGIEWLARSAKHIAKGRKVTVTGLNGVYLKVN